MAAYAKKSFAAFAAASPVGGSPSQGGWTIESPGADRFFFPSESPREFRLEFDARPFLAAGLDAERLASSSGGAYNVKDGVLSLAFPAGALPQSGPADVVEAFNAFIAANRDRVGYHHELDHYGIVLGGGSLVEWAKDMAKNEKDLVFVLNPEPFAAAGADPSSIDGWVYAQVPVRDEAGKMIQVWKLLRPYDLR